MPRLRRPLWLATAALAAFFFSVEPAFGQGMASENVSPTGDIDLTTVPPDQILGAVAAARKAIQQHPDSAEGYLQLAIALRSGNDQPGALAAIDRALALDPHLHGAWLQKGLISIDGGTLKAAIVYFRNAVESDPQSVAARLEYSSMLFRPATSKARKSKWNSSSTWTRKMPMPLGG